MSELSTYETTVNSFYLAFFGRPADPAGLAFWSGHLAGNGGDHRFMTEGFATSEEARVRFGDDTPAERIAEIYQQLFNRAPDAAGLAYWANVVEQGHASLADVAVVILGGAQGADARLADLREQASADFTALVEQGGSAYTGYAAVEAARVLVRAVTSDASQEDIAALVQAVAAFTDIASNNPAVIEAIATGSTLLALFDTPRGLLDPVTLVQALADVAKAAAGSPATLESLLRGGGMAKVLEVMPARATLQDVVDALATGGLDAAIEVVYPPRPVTPSPSTPVSLLKFDSVESGLGDRDLKDHVTKVEKADVKFTYDGAVNAGQSFQYTIDGGKHWISAGIDTSTRGVVVLKDVDLTIGAQDLPPPRMGIMEVEPVKDVLTTVQLRLVGADKQEILSATETLVLDRFAEMLDVALVNATASHFGGFSTGNTNVAGFTIDGLEQGAIVQYLYMSPGANMATWTNSLPALQDGMHTVQVRQLDAAGNASEAKEMRFNLNRETLDAPTIRLANDTGIDDKDGVTSDGTVIIEGLGDAWVTGWEYSVDDGKSWTFGGVSKDGVVPQLELGTLDIATGALLVRQINYAGNASVASNKLEFTFDDTKPTEVLSFQRIEGELDGVLKTDQDKVDLTFGVAHKDDGIVQWRVKGSADWVTVNAYHSNGSFTLEGIDLAAADPTIELQVIDAAGNVGFEQSWDIDGPAGLSVEKTVAGLKVTSSSAGAIVMGNVQIGAIGQDGGTANIGQQPLAFAGTLTLERAQGAPLTESGSPAYYLGFDGADTFKGSNLWGFDGDDTLYGMGNDFISGGNGNDTIFAYGGNDFISGGAGADTITMNVDGKTSILAYDGKDTRLGSFGDGTVISGMDRITGAEAGDVIKVGQIFASGPGTVSGSYLLSDDSGQVAVIQGRLAESNTRFQADSTGKAYMVQWTDTIGINSIVFTNYSGAALGLEVNRDAGTMTLVEAPVASSYKSIAYSFTATDSAFYLDGTPDGIVHSGVGNGLLAGQNFWLENALTSTQADSDYTSGPGFGIGIDGNMHFGRALEAGVYTMSFNKDTFATDSGYLAADDITFAGGVAGNIVQDGFSVPSFLPINYTLNDAGSNVSKMYAGYGANPIQLTTGTQQDVILASGGVQMDIRYGHIDSSAQDMLIGFGGDDQLLFQGVAETTIDKNQNGMIDWALSGTLEAHHEGIAIDIEGVIVTSELDNDDSATLQTLRALDVQVLATRDLVILARDTAAESAILLHYSDSDGNGIINGGEVQVIATFFDNVPLTDEINVIGTYAE
ncbi:DUF4214 domain-containing protein [Massilia sp. CFBP9026]|uniref:DUF4214 domain-containing protein n=1 Tax=Massilia sp. CFBP9026 TaxID=3096536 RepID=UPI002A6A5F31|nr:DUF4214 domain-containing protein [Massilia sp. CFBP9026]MDY0962218.1 DUF4214 domain-containing protein [Massilia sp. CFBP9026]